MGIIALWIPMSRFLSPVAKGSPARCRSNLRAPQAGDRLLPRAASATLLSFRQRIFESLSEGWQATSSKINKIL